MMLLCKLCGHQFISARPGEKASTSVIDQLMQHLAYLHKDDAAELAAAIAGASGYLAVRMFAKIPDEENELRARLAETERELFALISGDAVTRLRDVLMENPKGGRGGAN